jgi:hypothetical protein
LAPSCQCFCKLLCWRNKICQTHFIFKQGDNSAEIAEAQAKLKAVQVAFDAADARARESQAAAAESKARADEAKV